MKIKFHWGSKDGGAESHVYAYGIEIKALVSVLVLRFEDGTRDAYHTHAFNAVSWVLSGKLNEDQKLSSWENQFDTHKPSVHPIVTLRSTFHRVRSIGTSWVLSLRGPWADTWTEAVPSREGRYEPRTLTHGRRIYN